jgi:hypothetical protein
MRPSSVRLALLASIAAASLTACSQGDTSTASTTASTPASASAAVKVLGPPESCVPLSRVRESKVRDDRTIDFISQEGKVWRNTLPNTCPGLFAQNGFSYKTSLTVLCKSDIIHVLDTTGGGVREGVGCGLGAFTPVEVK